MGCAEGAVVVVFLLFLEVDIIAASTTGGISGDDIVGEAVSSLSSNFSSSAVSSLLTLVSDDNGFLTSFTVPSSALDCVGGDDVGVAAVMIVCSTSFSTSSAKAANS